MLSFIVKPSSFSLILLLFFSFTVLTHSGKIVKVKKICSQCQNPKFCSKVLNSMPGGARGKDLVTLAEYTIGVAQANLSGAITLLKTLINNATDPAKKRQYTVCYTIYSGEIVGVFEALKGHLKDGYYGDISSDDSLIRAFLNKCLYEIPVDDKSPIMGSTDDLSNFGNIVSIIGDLLEKA